MELKNKTAIVTGGGRGIGRGIVERFTEEGARVAIIQRGALDPDLESHPDILAIPADLSVVAGFPAIAERVHQHFGRVDTLVNNAGVMFERKVRDITESDWGYMAALNLRAPLFLAQAVIPYMRLRGGSIINIGSIEGIGANPQHVLYSTTKAGIHGMTRALAVDLGPDGIRCNAIAPGWIDTDLSENYLATMTNAAGARASLAALHPVGRTGRGSDVGDLAVFLASERSAFMTGETLVLDGGRTARLPLPG